MKKIPLNHALSKRQKEEGLSKEQLAKQKELQASYDAECRKLNAARQFPDAAKSVEAIRLCGDNIVAIKHEARELQLQINIASEESFGTDEPHVHITKEGQAVFVCGDVRFNVDIKDLNKVLGTNGEDFPLHKLMDSQLMELARSAGLNIEPFVRELLEVPLRGLLQIVWYRDVEKHSSKHLDEGQQRRVEQYHHDLRNWEAKQSEASSDSPTGSKRARSASAKVTIPVSQHKKLLELHGKGQSTGEIAVALGMERSKASRSAVRIALRSLQGGG